MFSRKYHHLKNKEIYILIFLFLFSFLIRIPAIFILGDTSLENEWKDIVNNLIEHKQFLYRDLPNLFMPPLYAFYLYFFSTFGFGEQLYISTILYSQILLSAISIIIFYKLNKNFFSEKISFYSSILLSLFPLYIYACVQISSITLQVFLIILFFFYFFKFIKLKNFFSIFLLSIVCGLLILLRGEFIIIFTFSIFYLFLFFKIKIKNILLIVLLTTITISPYLVRNILMFDSFAITKSFGYNLWKGNNPNSLVEGSVVHNKDLEIKIKNVPQNKYYSSKIDKIYFDEALKNIMEEPKRYLILFFKKFVSILFIDFKSTYPNYYHPMHYLPLLLFGTTSLLGIALYDRKSHKLNYLILIFFLTVAIFSSFSILPRYKLAILPLQIIFTNILISYIYKKFFNRHE